MGATTLHYLNCLRLLFKQWLAYVCTFGSRSASYFNPKARTEDFIQDQDKIPILLPIDLIEHIADYLFEINYPTHPKESSGRTAIVSSKPPWGNVVGFISASAAFHNIGMRRWVQVLSLNSKEDIESAIKYAHWIREIRCFNQSPLESQYGRLFNHFSRLQTLSLDLHGDIHHDGRRFAYRDVFTSLPSSLHRLEIRNAHGPDAKIIATVKKCCPDLQELRLGRCNMFNRSPACEFWRAFPFEHDSYISSDGTDEYASSLAQELVPLRRLKLLEVGIYLIPTSVVLAHRIYHAHKLPTPQSINWQQAVALAREAPEALVGGLMPPGLEPASADDLVDLLHRDNPEPNFKRQSCEFCEADFLQANVDAELSATRTLKSLLPSLNEVQWQGWFTPNHLGTSSCPT